MGTVFVARSVKLAKWASDVGLSKHIYKLGYTDEDSTILVATGWAGETDWALVSQQKAEDLTEDALIARLARKEKMIDPQFYPRIRGTLGLFKIPPDHVENHIIVTRALAGGDQAGAGKLKPVDFAAYMLHNALR